MLQFSLEATLGFHLITAVLSRELRNYVDRCAAFLGMSSVELVVLYVVQKFGEATVLDIARASTYAVEDIAAALDELARAEFVVDTAKGGCRLWTCTVLGTELLQRLSQCQITAREVGTLEPEILAERIREALAGLEL